MGDKFSFWARCLNCLLNRFGRSNNVVHLLFKKKIKIVEITAALIFNFVSVTAPVTLNKLRWKLAKIFCVVNCAQSSLNSKVHWGHMSEHIQMRNHSAALIVTKISLD